jgi:hypothetical protein
MNDIVRNFARVPSGLDRAKSKRRGTCNFLKNGVTPDGGDVLPATIVTHQDASDRLQIQNGTASNFAIPAVR